jgi:two-component system, sensor histidine kinase RegB
MNSHIELPASIADNAADPADTAFLNTPPAAATALVGAAGHKNMQQLIQLRWIAVCGQITTIAVAIVGFHIPLPLPHMLEVLSCLIAFNVASQLRWHESRKVSNTELILALLVDVAILTAQLYLSGGITNPFVFLYLLQVILSSVLLEAKSTWLIVAVITVCLAGLSLFPDRLVLPPTPDNSISRVYIAGLVICFLLNASLLVTYITRINDNRRAGAEKLAEMRRHAVEEEHIVRMGLLASGAAHELGTPLATMSVILGDWKHMPQFAGSEIRQDITEMQAQLERCKNIVSGILLSAGEARGFSSARTTINAFLQDLVDDWRTSRNIVTFIYENRIEHDVAVVQDSAVKQMICNVLDNALEASPQWVSMEVRSEEDALLLTVTDRGPGFAPPMLARIGKPYQSTKGRPGSGLGLFFVVNVARKIDGTVKVSNRSEGGAAVQLRLPLASFRYEEKGGAVPGDAS